MSPIVVFMYVLVFMSLCPLNLLHCTVWQLEVCGIAANPLPMKNEDQHFSSIFLQLITASKQALPDYSWFCPRRGHTVVSS